MPGKWLILTYNLPSSTAHRLWSHSVNFMDVWQVNYITMNLWTQAVQKGLFNFYCKITLGYSQIILSPFFSSALFPCHFPLNLILLMHWPEPYHIHVQFCWHSENLILACFDFVKHVANFATCSVWNKYYTIQKAFEISL